MTDDARCPDLEPDGLGDLKEIKRLPRMQKLAPNIRWGKVYESWPIERRLRYAERLASSMNHAADVLQQERNELIKLAQHQEEQLEHSARTYLAQGDVMHKELGNADAEKQQLYKQIIDLTQRVKVQARRIRELENGA